MPYRRKGDKPSWEATGSRNDQFMNIVTQKKETVDQWRSEMDADKVRRLGTTGVYNSKTGERDYNRFVPYNKRKRV